MSITDVMSELTANQQLAGGLAVSPTQADPPAPVSGASSFAALLAALTGTPSSGSAAAGTTAAAGSTATGGASETELISSMLAQSQTEALIGTLGGGDDSDSFDDLGGIEQLAALLPATSAAAGTATAAGATASAAYDPTGSSAERVLAAAQSQLGVSEQPPGSNDGPQIAVYRDAVAGSQPGEPWCAYFASWAAAQAGEPLGPDGQGFGSVAQLTDWAASAGRLLPASATPEPGDLILFGDRHVGIVESVNPDGSLTTVEGNYANAVTQVHRLPSEATGYVQM